MIIRWIIATVFFSLVCFQASANNNPFEKKILVNIGSDAAWKIENGQATKSGKDKNGLYYHLVFNKKQLQLIITKDKAGQQPKQFTQYGVQDVLVDGKQMPLFKWCLTHQERHHRYLQQDLAVKNDICIVDGEQGMFTVNLNRSTLELLENGKRLVFMIKPYRTPVKLNIDLTDFQNMIAAMVVKPTPAARPEPVVKAKVEKKCWAGPPANFSKIKAVEYECNNPRSKKDAELEIIKLVNEQKAIEKQAVLAKQKSLKEKQQRELEAKRKKEETLRQQEAQRKAEADAIAASEAKKSVLSSEITIKMVGMCKKFWDKGEHRCYCQKYIDYAPAAIKAGSTCK